MGVPFVDAVRDKYEHKVGSEEGGELVGGDKTGAKQALAKLTRVFVADSDIDSPGGDGDVAATCGAIEELDLGGNRLCEWSSLVALVRQLPKLHWLGLDRVGLAPLDALPEGFGGAVGGLRTLCVSGTGMAWEQLLLLSGAMPLLEELHFADNCVTSLRPASGEPIATLQRVRSLYLEGNSIAAWEDVLAVGGLPELQLLNLNHNQVGTVPADAGAAPRFGSLRHLMLRGNPISEWASIDALNGFAHLTEMRLAELPLLSGMSGAVGRRTIVARLGKLAALNGSEVRGREREDAERFYLRQIAQEYPEGGLPADAVTYPNAPADAQKDEFGRPVDEFGRPLPGGGELSVPPTEEWDALQRTHPRWAALLLHHGVHVTRTVTQASGGVIANELLEISLRATSAEAAHLPAVTRKLPGGLPLKSVKLIACQLFKVEPTQQQLLYCPPGCEKEIPEVLEDDSKSLADLGVVSNGTIVIEQLG
jgi:hypothetical protein